MRMSLFNLMGFPFFYQCSSYPEASQERRGGQNIMSMVLNKCSLFPPQTPRMRTGTTRDKVEGVLWQ
jgi:hypothetical protein